MWGLALGIPAGVGALTGLVFPLWQRGSRIANLYVRHVLLWVLVAIMAVAVQFAFLPPMDAFLGLFSLDFVLWLVCAGGAGTCFHLLRIMTRETDEAQATVLGKLRHSIRFQSGRTHETTGIALVFDVEGFAAFFNQPWARNYITEYLDHIFRAVSIELLGGRRFWGNKSIVPPLMHPSHQKFLGDGALFIWTPQAGKKKFSDDFVGELVHRLCRFKLEFPAINKASAGTIPRSFKLPKMIRWGLARGRIFELNRRGSYEREYMGFCVNLASRLQAYCRELSLNVSSRVRVPAAVLEREGLMKVKATRIKGFLEEEVIIEKAEWHKLSQEAKRTLFEPLETEA